MVLFYALLATPYFDGLFYGYLEINAHLSSSILNVLGQSTQVSGLTIQSSQFSVAIERGCDAVEPTWLVLAAVLSYHARFIHKVFGILAGAVILQLLNLIRIITLYWIGLHLPAAFNTVHMEIWPAIFILSAVVLFVYWRDWTSNREEMNAAA